jgi:hypothetical protein
MHESWPKVVQARLRAANLDVTVLNAGVPGWSPDQSYRYAQRVVGPLAVDIVLFGLNSNDLHDVIDAPLFDVRDGHLIPLRGERTWIHLQGRLAAALPSPLARMRTVRLLLASLRGADLYGQRPALDPEALQEWARTKIRTEVLTLHQSLRRDDVALVVVITPRGGSLDSLVGDFERASLPVLRVTPPADGEARYYFPRDGHLTPAGNDFVGRRVATDNDVLVVDTVGLEPGTLVGSTPHSAQLHVVERFSVDPATTTLKREVRAEDPLYFTEPYTRTDTMILSAVPYAPEPCEDLTPVVPTAPSR